MLSLEFRCCRRAEYGSPSVDEVDEIARLRVHMQWRVPGCSLSSSPSDSIPIHLSIQLRLHRRKANLFTKQLAVQRGRLEVGSTLGTPAFSCNLHNSKDGENNSNAKYSKSILSTTYSSSCFSTFSSSFLTSSVIGSSSSGTPCSPA